MSYCFRCGKEGVEEVTHNCMLTGSGYIQVGPPTAQPQSVVTVYVPPCPRCASFEAEVARLTGLLTEARRYGFYAGFAYRSNGYTDHVHGADLYCGCGEGLAPKESSRD